MGLRPTPPLSAQPRTLWSCGVPGSKRHRRHTRRQHRKVLGVELPRGVLENAARSGGSGQYRPAGLRSGSGRYGVAGGAGMPHGHGPRSLRPASTRVGRCQHMRCCDALPLSALHRAHCPERRVATVPHLLTTPMAHVALCSALYVRTRYKEVVTVQSTAASSQIRLPAAREGGAEGCQKPRCCEIPQAFITYDNTSVWRRHFARSADACQLRYPQINSRHCPVCGVFLSGTIARRAAVPLEDATTGRTTPQTVMAC